MIENLETVITSSFSYKGRKYHRIENVNKGTITYFVAWNKTPNSFMVEYLLYKNNIWINLSNDNKELSKTPEIEEIFLKNKSK